MKTKTMQNLGLIFRLSPLWFVEIVLWSVFNCIISVFNVWLTGRITLLISSGISKEMLCLVFLYGILLILSAFFSVYYKRYRVQFLVIPGFEQKVRSRLFKKSRMISNESFESASGANMIRLADGAKQNLFRYIEIWISILTTFLEAIIVTMYVSTFDMWFLLLLPFAFIPTLLNLLYQSRLWKRYYIALEQCKKEESAYFKGLIDEIACKESRITYASDLLSNKWRASREERDSVEQKKSTKLLALQMILTPVELIGTFGGYLMSVILLFYGRIDYAICTASIVAYASITSSLSSFVSMIGYEGQYRRMIQPFFNYLDQKERSASECVVPFEKEIRLERVSFKYPGQEMNALDNIDLNIRKGEVIAIVGENGAGKTTLANIILGLFLPISGTVYYDAMDISKASELRLHEKQSIVSQVFARYKMTVRDNITISDFDKKEDGNINEGDISFLCDSHLSLDTMLGKEFGGRDLSGGQWQMLSCARGFYKNSEFLVLDEATSAIDPLKEKAIYDSFKCELKGKTGIIITHRLGAVSLADRVIVLEKGHIVQEGTHHELLEEDGPYKQLWDVQANSFI